jgi:peroxiredoxin/predicted 2-oxoglutarate/Fe(II)-dependent dioxygenase YbiX
MPIPAIAEPAPPFTTTLSDGLALNSDDLAGCFTTLCFFGSCAAPQMGAMAAAIASNSEIFDGLDHRFLGISIDPDDAGRTDLLPGDAPAVRWAWDFDQSLSRAYGAAPESDNGEEVAFQPLTVVLDAAMRVLVCHKVNDPENHPAELAQFLNNLPTLGPPRLAQHQAPVLLVPMAFEQEFCRRLIAHFEETGGSTSGILADVDGKTELTFDADRKRRLDVAITDQTLQQGAHLRIARRVAPEIRKAFQLNVTRLERSVIARYGTGDFFGRHRDNSAVGTAHRAFSITIALNADNHTGGHLRFPEFGPQIYQIPVGCAIVHSCGLLHEVLPVREGHRYVYIPVVYDEAGAARRAENSKFLGENVSMDRREFLSSSAAEPEPQESKE